MCDAEHVEHLGFCYCTPETMMDGFKTHDVISENGRNKSRAGCCLMGNMM